MFRVRFGIIEHSDLYPSKDIILFMFWVVSKEARLMVGGRVREGVVGDRVSLGVLGPVIIQLPKLWLVLCKINNLNFLSVEIERYPASS